MITDHLRKLQENNQRLIKMRDILDAIIIHNNDLIAEIEHELPEIKDVKSTVPKKTKASPKKDTTLKSIAQLWADKTDPYLIVRKPKWTPGFCFVVRSIEGNRAVGTTYICSEDGSVLVYKENKTYGADDGLYVTLQDHEDYVKKAIAIAESGSIDENASIANVSHYFTGNKNNNDISICVGSIVTILDCSTEEILELRVVSSYYNMTYKTMGYRTKNYTEETLTSDADGVDSISDSSPLGIILIGKHTGDEVSISSNGEFLRYRVIAINNTNVYTDLHL